MKNFQIRKKSPLRKRAQGCIGLSLAKESQAPFGFLQLAFTWSLWDIYVPLDLNQQKNLQIKFNTCVCLKQPLRNKERK